MNNAYIDLRQEYARYYKSMVKDKMIPLSFNAWAEAKKADEQRYHEENKENI
jgi:hypothetical protein